VNLPELALEARRLSDLLDNGLKVLREASVRLAHAENAYRKGVARAWLEAPDGISPARQAWVDAECADLRTERDLADAERSTAAQAVKARGIQLTLVMSLLSAHKAEVGLAR
jgi:hypothetical protein